MRRRVLYVRLFFIAERGSEIVENYEKAEQDYMAGMKYKDIAEKYGTTINTVKSWKKRYAWSRGEGAHKTENKGEAVFRLWISVR